MSQNILPTRMQLQNLKGRLIAAQKGYSLLKKKSDALQKRYRALKAIIRGEKEEMTEYMRKAHFALSQVTYVAGNISTLVSQSVSKDAKVKVKSRIENVAGVLLPAFDIVSEPITDLTGLNRGGDQIKNARNVFTETLKFLVKLSADQASYLELHNVIRVTTRRVNALENVVIPKLESNIAYIQDFLDELDREEFFRLKMISKKKEARAKEDIEAHGAPQEGPELSALSQTGMNLADEDVNGWEEWIKDEEFEDDDLVF